MRHFARPRFGASRVLHSRARGPHGRHATSRVVPILIALVAVCLGLPSTNVGAAPTTTTTLSPTVVLKGNAYARHLLDAQPIPPDARGVTTLPTPLAPNGDFGESPLIRQDHRLYLLPMSVSVDQFVRAHLLKGERITETGTGTAPHTYPTYNLGVSPTCASPHITFCGVYYQTTEAKNGEQELRVDVQVIYLPTLRVQMPTDGIVTVTGYGATSLTDPSSDPASVVLSRHQALTLRTVIARMKDLGFEDTCMEDSLLLKIKVVRHGRVVWSATADECPGALAITTATSNPILDGRSCPFWHVVNTFFVAGTANATKSQIHGCADSQYS